MYFGILKSSLSPHIPELAKRAMTSAPTARPVVVSGPSGSGKSTLLNRLFKEHPGRFGLSVSHTTRRPRPGEQDGREYHFVDRAAFESMVQRECFVEHAQFSGNLYGTSLDAVESVLSSGKTCILDLELNGVKSMRRMAERFNPLFVFVQPPSIGDLRQRLASRNTETPESLEARLHTAQEAMEYAALPCSYDCIIVNDSLDAAYQEFSGFILSHLPHRA